MIFASFFSALLLLISVSSALPIQQQKRVDSAKIKFVIFHTGNETPEQLAMMPKILQRAQMHGFEAMQEETMPTDGASYTSASGEQLHASWIKVEKTLAAMKESTEAEWVLAFELSSLTEASGALDFNALIGANAGSSVFLKRSGMGFSMALYRNDPQIQKVLQDLWAKRSASGSVGAAFASYTFWNPLLLTQIKFL